MTASEALPKVLDRIDRDLDASLDRLFALLRIQSISTDPAFAPHCRSRGRICRHRSARARLRDQRAADRTAIRSSSARAATATNGDAPRVLFYGHYDVQPVDPLELWKTPPFEPRIETLDGGRKIIVARGACDDKGQAMTFVEACRAFKAVTGALPLDITMMIEGEEECGSKHLFGFVRDNAAELRRDLALVCDTGMWDAQTPSITTLLRGLVYEEIGSPAPTATCIRGCSAARRAIRSMCSPTFSPPCTMPTAASPFRASTTASTTCRPTSRPISKAFVSLRKNSSARSA